MAFSDAPPLPLAQDRTRDRLLEAAERILVEQGVHALTVRRIGQVSGLNGTLVTYHFGTMTNLVAELARRNLDPMIDAWQALASAVDEVPALLTAWLAPLLHPAAFNPTGRALLVLDELASHGNAALRDDVMQTMVRVAGTVRQRLAPLLPALSDRELATRLRFIAGATLGPPPREHADNAPELAGLLRFALAALGAA